MRKSQVNDRFRLIDMLYAARLASDFVYGTERASVEANIFLQQGLAKFIQDIGEAANRVTSESQARHPQIPWRDAIAMRNYLVHEYSKINLDVLWDTALNDLPPLIAALEAILSDDP